MLNITSILSSFPRISGFKYQFSRTLIVAIFKHRNSPLYKKKYFQKTIQKIPCGVLTLFMHRCGEISFVLTDCNRKNICNLFECQSNDFTKKATPWTTDIVEVFYVFYYKFKWSTYYLLFVIQHDLVQM